MTTFINRRAKVTGAVSAAPSARLRASGTVRPALPRVTSPRAGKWVVGYMPGWKNQALPTSDIPWAHLTHIALFSVRPNADGTLDDTFFLSTSSAGRAWAKGVADAAHTNGVKVLLTLGGAGFKANFTASISASLRSKFISNILALVDYLGADVVDVDFEPLPAEDVTLLATFLEALRTARPSLPLALPCGQVNANNPSNYVTADTARFGVCEQVNFMTYGMGRSWTGWTSWHSSPLYGHTVNTHPASIDNDVQVHLNQGLQSRKLGVGVGGYGVGWTGVTGPDQTGGTVAIDGADCTIPACEATYAPLMTRLWDDTAKVPYLSSATAKGPGAVTYVSFEDTRSIGEKVAYVKRRRLGGLIIWHLEQLYVPSRPTGQRFPLLQAISDELKGGRVESVTPPEPTFTNGGAGSGTYTIPTMPGVTYLVAGAVKPAGAYAATGTVTVTAAAELGRTITAGASGSWTHTFPTATVTTNYVPNPRMVSGGTSMLESSSGSSYLTGTSGWPSNTATTTARRRAASADGTLTQAPIIDVSTVPEGAQMIASADLRLTQARTAKWSWTWYDTANAVVGTSWYSSTTGTWAAGETRRIEWPAQTKPAGAVSVRLSVSMNSAVVGDSIDTTNWFVTAGGVLPAFFDGATPDAAGVDYAWTGAAYQSPSTKTT